MLDLLDKLGIADNTFVMYSTDNGPHQNSWPDAGTTPFRSEKNTCWEGAFRVPCLVRYPGKIEAGSVCNGIVSHLDWFPTFANLAGAPNVKEDLKKGTTLDGNKYKAHLDGYDLVDFLTGKAKESPRPGFFYFNDDSDVVALRYDNWKIVFLEQRVEGTMQIWAEPFVELRVPKIFNLKTDPYERADKTSNTYYDWLLDHVFLLVPAQAVVGDFLKTFVAFPPAQKAASFSIDQVMEKLQSAAAGGGGTGTVQKAAAAVAGGKKK
jgi:arylsulfatase